VPYKCAALISDPRATSLKKKIIKQKERRKRKSNSGRWLRPVFSRSELSSLSSSP
jgi:hypothetical protein